MPSICVLSEFELQIFLAYSIPVLFGRRYVRIKSDLALRRKASGDKRTTLLLVLFLE